MDTFGKELKNILGKELKLAWEGFMERMVEIAGREIADYLNKKRKEAFSFCVEKGYEIFERKRVPIDEILNEVAQKINNYQSKLQEIRKTFSAFKNEWRNKIENYLKQLDEIDREKVELLQRENELVDIVRTTGIKSAEDWVWLQKEYTALKSERDKINNKEAEIYQNLLSLLRKEIAPLIVEEFLVEKNLYDFKGIHNYLSELRKHTSEVTLEEWGGWRST